MNTSDKENDLKISKDAKELLTPEIDFKINTALESDLLWLKAHVHWMLVSVDDPLKSIQAIAEAQTPLILSTEKLEEVQSSFCNTIWQLLYHKIQKQDNYQHIQTIEDASNRILNEFLNIGCYKHALELPVLSLNHLGDTYIWSTKIGGKSKKYQFQFWKYRSQAEALCLALDSRAKFQQAQKSFSVLNELKKDWFVEILQDGNFRVKWMYFADSKHGTPWVYIYQPWEKVIWRSLEKNDRWFTFWFKRIMNALFEKNPQLTVIQKRELMNLWNQNIYPKK